MKKTLKKYLALLLATVMLIGASPIIGVDFSTLASAADENDLAFKLINNDSAFEISGCSVSASDDLIIPAIFGGVPVTSIGNYAFKDCTELNSVTIPDTVTSIGYEAFLGCTSLNSITIPDSVTSICSDAFYNSAWYNNQPDGIVYSGKVAYNYKGTMPDGTSIIIKDGTKSIADYAFAYRMELSSLTIPDSVTSIGDNAFWGCTSLSDITVSSDNSNFSSQDGVLFNKDKTCLIQYPRGNTRTRYTIPDSVTSIGKKAFFGCQSLSSITIPDSVTSIGSLAFSDCTVISSITIPDSVTSIGSDVFYNTALYNNQPDGIVYVGKVAYDYKGTMPDGTVLDIRDGTKVIADSALYGCTKLSSVTIPDSVEYIGVDAFYNCTGLSTITIPDSVKGIGDGAFGRCAGLNSAIIGNGVTSINNWTFSDCTSLSSVTIPDSVTSIGDGAFVDCTGLSDIYYGGNESDRTNIVISSFGYETLENATWHYSIVVTGVSLDITSKTLVVSEAQQLTATVAPDDATNKKVIWSSSNTAIATVDENGLVSAIAAGTATITAKTGNKSKTATCAITVICPTVSIKNLNNSAVIKYGETLRLTAVTTDMPKGAKVVWSVEGTGVKIVASDDGTTCDITSTESGRVTVTAKIVDADGKPIKGGDDNEISSSQQVESKAGFFQKLIAFFKRLFGLVKTIIQSVDR